MKLEEKLSILRKKEKLSQAELAEMMDVSRQAVSKWEVGAVTPSLENLQYFANLYGVSLDYLLDNSAEEEETDSADESVPPAAKKHRALKLVLIGGIILAVAIFFAVRWGQRNPTRHFDFRSMQSEPWETEDDIAEIEFTWN